MGKDKSKEKSKDKSKDKSYAWPTTPKDWLECICQVTRIIHERSTIHHQCWSHFHPSLIPKWLNNTDPMVKDHKDTIFSAATNTNTTFVSIPYKDPVLYTYSDEYGVWKTPLLHLTHLPADHISLFHRAYYRPISPMIVWLDFLMWLSIHHQVDLVLPSTLRMEKKAWYFHDRHLSIETMSEWQVRPSKNTQNAQDGENRQNTTIEMINSEEKEIDVMEEKEIMETAKAKAKDYSILDELELDDFTRSNILKYCHHHPPDSIPPPLQLKALVQTWREDLNHKRNIRMAIVSNTSPTARFYPYSPQIPTHVTSSSSTRHFHYDDPEHLPSPLLYGSFNGKNGYIAKLSLQPVTISPLKEYEMYSDFHLELYGTHHPAIYASIMEELDVVSLYRVAAKERRGIDLINDILHQLKRLHSEHQQLHADIKPENIMKHHADYVLVDFDDMWELGNYDRAVYTRQFVSLHPLCLSYFETNHFPMICTSPWFDLLELGYTALYYSLYPVSSTRFQQKQSPWASVDHYLRFVLSRILPEDILDASVYDMLLSNLYRR